MADLIDQRVLYLTPVASIRSQSGSLQFVRPRSVFAITRIAIHSIPVGREVWAYTMATYSIGRPGGTDRDASQPNHSKRKIWRARYDSNVRPSAPQGAEGVNNDKDLGSRRGRSRQAAASSGVQGVARTASVAMRRPPYPRPPVPPAQRIGSHRPGWVPLFTYPHDARRPSRKNQNGFGVPVVVVLLTPAHVHFGRQHTVLSERSKIKRTTTERRKKEYLARKAA